MAQLVHFIRANGGKAQVLFQYRKVSRGACHKRNTGTGKGHFGGGAKNIDAVFSTLLTTVIHNIGQLRCIVF